MTRLGGASLGFAESAGTSVEKGENLADTVRVVESYADIIVIRHPLEGSARLAAEFSNIPVINAGSGAEEHPTQALLDLYTIRRELGRLNDITVGMMGDLRYGRTVHSLAYALSLFKTRLVLISPEALRMRREVLEDIGHRAHVKEVADLKPVLKELDVLYVTRIQKERFPDPAEYEKVRGSYRLQADDVRKLRKGSIVMHPLPRVDEVAYEVDQTPYAKYFKQAWYGMLVRMSLLSLVLGGIK